MLATKIEKHIIFSKLTEEDLIDLLTICGKALVQCKANDYHEIDFQTAVEWSDCIQDSFSSIKETEALMQTGLTRNEWSQLTQYLGQELQFRYRD